MEGSHVHKDRNRNVLEEENQLEEQGRISKGTFYIRKMFHSFLLIVMMICQLFFHSTFTIAQVFRDHVSAPRSTGLNPNDVYMFPVAARNLSG
jgi:hypothetical protein